MVLQVGQGDGQGIGGIRQRCLGEAEPSPDHKGNLLFIRRPPPDHRLFDPFGWVFKDRNPFQGRGQNGGRPRRPHGDGCPVGLDVNDRFDGTGVRAEPADDVPDTLVGPAQALGLAELGRVFDDPEFAHDQVVALAGNNAVAGAPQGRINAKYGGHPASLAQARGKIKARCGGEDQGDRSHPTDRSDAPRLASSRAIGHASRMGKVLVIRGGALGDFVLTLPAIRLLKDGLPEARIEVLGYDPMVKLALTAGVADGVRPLGHAGLAGFFAPDARLDPGWADYFAGFDVVFSFLHDPHGHFRENVLRTGMKTFFQGVWKVSDEPGDGHAAEQLAAVCQNLALWLEDPAPVILLPRPDAERRGLAVHPGSGSVRESWLFARWVEAGPALAALLRPGEFLEVISGEAEEEWIRDLLAAWRGLPVRHHHHTPLPELAEHLAACRAYLGHDTGISHLAAACGVPCLLLFGPTLPEIWAPRNPGVRVLRAPGGHLDQLAVEPVVSAVGEWMEEINPAPPKDRQTFPADRESS